MGRVKRSRTHHGIRDNSRKMRTRAHTQDLDQIHADLARGKPDPLLPSVGEVADEMPGGAQFFCIECRYY